MTLTQPVRIGTAEYRMALVLDAERRCHAAQVAHDQLLLRTLGVLLWFVGAVTGLIASFVFWNFWVTLPIVVALWATRSRIS